MDRNVFREDCRFHEIWVVGEFPRDRAIALKSSPVSLLSSLGPHGAIWSTPVQVMACCLMAPSHYLSQCWLIISKILWHSSEDIIIRRFQDTNQQSKIENYIFKITLRSPRDQWVNSLSPERCDRNFNPLHAKFFRENINLYLHFMLFLHIDKTQVVENFPHVRQEPPYSTCIWLNHNQVSFSFTRVLHAINSVKFFTCWICIVFTRENPQNWTWQ